MLVESLAVKATQGPIILGEVCWHPVHHDADAILVQGIDQLSEFIRRAPTRRRRVVARDLVSPGPAERMLGHGQELDVGETVLLKVWDEILAQAVVVGADLPRAYVHLIDAHRHIEVAGTLVHPGGIGPGETGGIHDRVRLRRAGGAFGQWVGLVFAAFLAKDGELIVLASTDARNKDLPYAGRTERSHWVLGRIPAAEIAHDGHALGIRGPHGKGDAGNGTHFGVIRAQVGAEDIPEALVAAFPNQVQIQRAHRGKEVIAVCHGAGRCLWIGDF